MKDVSFEDFIHKFEKLRNIILLFSYFIFKKKVKRLIDLNGHNLLVIDIMHLFTPSFKLYSVFLATKTNFLLFHKISKNNSHKIFQGINTYLTTLLCFKNDFNYP